ncbi:MAG: hypothetical protein H0V29_11260 [Thermoleophilaceae bacterium]|nr:hypothetical protein [Thermoleophilaceae bacterium]
MFKVGYHPQRVRNGVVRIADYPQGKYGEPFRLGVFAVRRPMRFIRGDQNIGCRAEGARTLRLRRCKVELRARGRGIARGERVVGDAASFKVDVNMNKRGRRFARRAGVRRVVLTARGTDSAGRTVTIRRKVKIRGR